MSQNQNPHGNTKKEAFLTVSWKKQILFSVILFFGFFLFLETGVRIGAYFLYNQNPYYLFYGLKSVMAHENPEGHTVAFEGYFKFPPSRILHQYGMFKKPSPIRINSLGFRGKDFKANKPENLFRVVSLGGSSTFGYYNRDAYTYPAILQRLMAKNLPTTKVQFINAGIPHAKSNNLLAMLRGEILNYRPNLITIYSGFNDAAYLMDPSVIHKVLRWVHMHFATYVALKRLISALGGPELHSRWALYTKTSNKDYVNQQIDLHVSRYSNNLRKMVVIAQKNQIPLIFIKQGINPFIWQKKMLKMNNMGYGEKVLWIKNRFENGEYLSRYEINMLVHNALMRTLEKVARGNAIPLVDNISILDKHPEYYASYVHLTEDGNKALSEKLFQAIVPIINSKAMN